MRINNLADVEDERYNIIYADPPWSYKDKKGCDPAMGGITYDVMELEDIKAMGENIKRIAARDSALFLWVTMPMLREGLEVIDAWGFNYKTCAFTWVKLDPSVHIGGVYGESERSETTINSNDIYSGLGHWTNGNAELCLFAKRGAPKRVSKSVKQIVLAPRGRHSSKPIEVRKRIEQLMCRDGDGKKLELFCRGTGGAGWDVWGNEAE